MPQIQFIHLDSVDSTNNYAIQLAKEGAAAGTVVWADEQTKGRGRFDRAWISEKGKDLLMSLILRPVIQPQEAPQITLKAAQGIAKALQDLYALPEGKLTIKPPNDILLQGKKVCGILTESASKGSQLDFVIVGVGINLNSSPGTHIANATSFYEALSRKIEITIVLKRIASDLMLQA